MIRFDGRVAIVTGGGRGLGRGYALCFAERGARVVVNDLGVDVHGGADSQSAADEVVAEITAAGGTAIANHDSAASAEGTAKIAQAALDHFGRADIVVNNAGFLRDSSMAKMSAGDIAAVIGVHLLGPMYLTRAVWPSMQENRYGRVILVSSAAGLYGNFGQSNYAAAKLGVVGFMNALKQESVKYGIAVNTVAPLAYTRQAEGAFDERSRSGMRIDWIVSLVAYLASEECSANGELIHAGAGRYARAQIFENDGLGFEPDAPIDPETIARDFSRIEKGAPSITFDSAPEAVRAKGMLPARP